MACQNYVDQAFGVLDQGLAKFTAFLAMHQEKCNIDEHNNL
jgi:hypothetical protein